MESESGTSTDEVPTTLTSVSGTVTGIYITKFAFILSFFCRQESTRSY